jgi:hypothetical protein
VKDACDLARALPLDSCLFEEAVSVTMEQPLYIGGGNIQPLASLPGTFFGIRFGTNYTTAQKAQDWTQLKVALTNLNARNMYYFGHGAEDHVGISGNGLTLTAKEVAALLHAKDSNPTNRHFFRYVFLDGCNTAKGDFPKSFGIPKKENVPLETYDHNKLRVSAFSGWSSFKTFSVAQFIPWQFPGYRINMFFYWSQANFALYQAHEKARIDCIGTGFAIGENLKIYGYDVMHFYDGNTNP